jgi:GTP-binding protein
MLEWTVLNDLPVHILLNKSDKVKRGVASSTLLQVKKQLQHLALPLSVQTFSAMKRDGVDELWQVLDGWLKRK